MNRLDPRSGAGLTHVALVSEHASPLAALGTPDAGGQNVYVACLAAALVQRGMRVTVHTRRDDPALPDRVRTARGYDVVHVPAGPPHPIDKDRLLPHMDEFALHLRRSFEHDRPEVVHSHFWMSGCAAFAAAGSVGVPVVHTFHALGTVKRRHQGDADTSPPERLGLEHQLLRHVDRVVATCRDEVDELTAMVESLDRPGRSEAPASSRMRVSVVPCGYDASVFRPEGPTLPRSQRHQLVAVSRLVPRKGLEDVVLALAAVPDAELVVAGGPPDDRMGADEHLCHLRDVAHRTGVAHRVRFVGGVAPNAVAALDRSADVFVAAPRYEPFGIAPVEAMACGTPVVGTAVGGLLDTVVDGGTGLLVPVGDVDALAAAVRSMLADPVRRGSYGERAAWRVRRRFSWSVVARSMEQVYRDVVDETRVGDAVGRHAGGRA